MLKEYQGALEDVDKADVLEPNNAFTLKIRRDVKRMLHDYQGALEDLDKADVLEPNNAFTFTIRGDVKSKLKNYQGTLGDLDKANFLEPNNAFTLRSGGFVKMMLHNNQGALEDLDKANVLDSNNAFTLRNRGNVKSMLHDNQGAKKSFISEVRTLGSIQHINLVCFLGYCIKGLKHMLVYEYISNSSVDKWFDEDNLLDWDQQMCIIIRVAQGLAHLHKCNPIIVHLDIKPQNILLDQDYTPKLVDFGLAKILDGKDEDVVCTPPFFLLLVTCMHTIS
jgi:serine/threonine protein kinase